MEESRAFAEGKERGPRKNALGERVPGGGRRPKLRS